MKKHAFLIIAHKDDYVLQSLIKTIDDERNDIYILVDKKTKRFNRDKIANTARKSEIIFVPSLKIYWGGYSLVKAEMKLFECARKYGEYTYYHLLSGVDLCIKNQNYIHDFFMRNERKLFIDYNKDDVWNEEIKIRIKYYHIQAGRSLLLQKFNGFLRALQKLLGINRLKNSSMIIKGGSNWASLPQDFVDYVLSQKNSIYKMFGKTLCADEIFLQTLAYNSPFKNRIFEPNGNIAQNVRAIDWQRGGDSPYIYEEDDYNELLNSEALFARKFLYNDDNKIVDKILDYLHVN